MTANVRRADQFRQAWASVEGNSLEKISCTLNLVCLAFQHDLDENSRAMLKKATINMDTYLNKNGVNYNSRGKKTMFEMSLAAGINAGFPEDEKWWYEMLVSVLVVLLLCRKDEATQLLKQNITNTVVLIHYLNGAILPVDETTILRRFATCVCVVKSTTNPSGKKCHLMNIAARLTDGDICITGSGQTPRVSKREQIFHKITGSYCPIP